MVINNAIQRILDQLSDVLQMAQDASKQPLKGAEPPNWRARLNRLKLMVAEFQQINEKILTEAGLSTPPSSEQKIPDDILQKLSAQDRLIVERANLITRDASKGYSNIAFSIKEIQKKKKASTTRKKKFDRLGGHKKWKPM